VSKFGSKTYMKIPFRHGDVFNRRQQKHWRASTNLPFHKLQLATNGTTSVSINSLISPEVKGRCLFRIQKQPWLNQFPGGGFLNPFPKNGIMNIHILFVLIRIDLLVTTNLST
jgi:hypothetical protein